MERGLHPEVDFALCAEWTRPAALGLQCVRLTLRGGPLWDPQPPRTCPCPTRGQES